MRSSEGRDDLLITSEPKEDVSQDRSPALDLASLDRSPADLDGLPPLPSQLFPCFMREASFSDRTQGPGASRAVQWLRAAFHPEPISGQKVQKRLGLPTRSATVRLSARKVSDYDQAEEVTYRSPGAKGSFHV